MRLPEFRHGPTALLYVLACGLGTGCPADESEDGTVGADTGSSSAATESADDNDGATSMQSTGNDEVGQTGSGGVDSSTGTPDGSTGDTGTTTGNDGVCDVMLPPPGDCTAEAPGGAPWHVAYLDGAWTAGGAWRPVSELADDDDPAAGGVAFIMRPDGGGDTFECDTIEQDCPAGEKCMPWSNDGGAAWNATRCSPIANNPNQVGDECTVEGSGVSGIDDCDLGAMCWDVDTDTNQGTCIEMCSCSVDNPICQTANTSCVISNEGSLTICLGVCNPLDTTACDEGQACYPFANVFHCAPDVGQDEGGQGEPCQFINACSSGFACVSNVVPGCTDGACCSAFCADDSACTDGTVCTPWYADGEAPDECLGMAGICAAP